MTRDTAGRETPRLGLRLLALAVLSGVLAAAGTPALAAAKASPEAEVTQSAVVSKVDHKRLVSQYPMIRSRQVGSGRYQATVSLWVRVDTTATVTYQLLPTTAEASKIVRPKATRSAATLSQAISDARKQAVRLGTKKAKKKARAKAVRKATQEAARTPRATIHESVTLPGARPCTAFEKAAHARFQATYLSDGPEPWRTILCGKQFVLVFENLTLYDGHSEAPEKVPAHGLVFVPVTDDHFGCGIVTPVAYPRDAVPSNDFFEGVNGLPAKFASCLRHSPAAD